MDRINNFSVYLFMISFIFIQTTCYPTPQNDLISGKDFLSLFLQENGDVKQNQRSNQRGRIKFHRIADDESILPIEAMFSSREEDSPPTQSSGYGRYRYSQARMFEPTLGTTTERVVTETSRGRTTVQMVKSGSKIIFMEELPTSTTTTMPPTTTEIPNETTTSQEVKVISVRVSQSVNTSPPKQQLTVVPQNSNSFRSEFSIEEDEEHKDSMKSESTNIQTIVAPPTDSNQARSRTQRTQRTQDGVVPYQTVIYHENSKMDKDNGQKAVSYSYVGQSADKLKTWKDIDGEYAQKNNSTDAKLPTDYWNNLKESEKKIDVPEKLPADFWNHPKDDESVMTEKSQDQLPADYWNPPASYDLPASYWKQPSSYNLPTSYWNPPTTTTAPTTISQSSSTTIWTNSQTTPGPIPRRITTNKRVVFNQLDKIPYDELNAPTTNNEDTNVLHNLIGKFSPKHPVVESTTMAKMIEEKPMMQEAMDKPINSDDSKVGYVVEGRNYRKYRVEEKTSDGFIVGEYGVVSHNDGNLRGVRYTAESNINPRLIYDALLKFLSL